MQVHYHGKLPLLIDWMAEKEEEQEMIKLKAFSFIREYLCSFFWGYFGPKG